MKSFLRKVLYAFGVIIVALLLLELYLRAAPTTLSPEDAYGRDYKASILSKIPYWNTAYKKTDTPLLPPFLVFSDEGYDDSARLTQVYEATKMDPSRTWVSYDFLRSTQSPASTTYTAHINALGFRGKEYAAQKKPGVYRIIVLGSYQAFGFGVADTETYEYQLEQTLNKEYPGTTFEVWNGGQPASTAIVGLARMKQEIFDYQPDLIVLDYGFVDAGVVNGSYMLKLLGITDPKKIQWWKSFQGKVFPALEHSFIWKKIWNDYYGAAMVKSEEADFENTMGAMVQLADVHKVPLLFVEQMWGPRINNFKEIAASNIPVVDALQVFNSHPPDYPPVSEWNNAIWGKTWLGELDPQFVHPPGDKEFFLYPYKLDIFQLSALGQKVLADGIANTIEKNFLGRVSKTSE